MTIPKGRPGLTIAETLCAAKARLFGEYDEPALVRFGPLSSDRIADVREIIACCPELLGPPSRPDAATLAATLRGAVDHWREFDGDDEVNGGDMVEWFGEWREQVKALLAGAKG